MRFWNVNTKNLGVLMNSDNPLLSGLLKIPGKTFPLPSRGLFYSNGELDESVKNGEVHVHPLSGFTELSLKSPDLLFNGKAIIRVFQECIPEIKKPLELAAKDVDAVLFFLRMVTYGSEFRIEVQHTCEHAKQHGYSVNLEQVLADATQLDPTMIETINHPVTVKGQPVFTRPIRFIDVVSLFHETGTKKEFSDEDLERRALTHTRILFSCSLGHKQSYIIGILPFVLIA
jgi:hypothetical protein